MQEDFFYKFSPATKLSHLYEHLFLRALIDTLHKNGLTEFIDYTAEGTTSLHGFIELALLFRKQHEALVLSTIEKLPVPTDEKSIDIAMSQLIAEKQRVASGDWQQIVAELSKLNELGWQSAVSLKTHSAITSQEADSAFWLTDEPVKLRRLHLKLTLPALFIRNHADLIPLAYMLGNTLHASMRQMLCNKYGYYSDDMNYSTSKDGYSSENTFIINSEIKPTVKAESEAIFSVLKDTLTQQVLHKLLAVLQDQEYIRSNYWYQPLNIFKRTGILIGSEGFKQCATGQNVQTVLRSLSLTIQYDGYKKFAGRVGDIIRDRT